MDNSKGFDVPYMLKLYFSYQMSQIKINDTVLTNLQKCISNYATSSNS